MSERKRPSNGKAEKTVKVSSEGDSEADGARCVANRRHRCARDWRSRRGAAVTADHTVRAHRRHCVRKIIRQIARMAAGSPRFRCPDCQLATTRCHWPVHEDRGHRFDGHRAGHFASVGRPDNGHRRAGRGSGRLRGLRGFTAPAAGSAVVVTRNLRSALLTQAVATIPSCRAGSTRTDPPCIRRRGSLTRHGGAPRAVAENRSARLRNRFVRQRLTGCPVQCTKSPH